MNPKNYIWIGIGAALAFALALLVLMPGARANNDPGPDGGTVSGDWTVTDSRSYSDVVIEVEDGNLLIDAGGSLTIYGVTLTFSSSQDGSYGIDVAANGAFDVLGACTITSSDPAVHYSFTVHGSMIMNDTAVSYVWGDNGSWYGGIQIFNDDVTITHSTMTLGRTGGISIFNCSPEIDYNTITNNGMDGQSPYYAYGIYAYNNHGNITGNTISENEYYSVDYFYKSGWMWPDQNYYMDYWNGEYWYYWYWDSSNSRYVEYRYESVNIVEATTHYGKGVYIEGGSTTYLANNTIEKNGWDQFETSYNYGPYWEDNWHYVMSSYRQINKIPSCVGIGVYSGNSSLTITGNKIDRNGYEPAVSTYTNWNIYPYITYTCKVSGVEVGMVNSYGDIASNSISDGAILIDNNLSSPNITSNNLLSDYGVDPNNGGDAAFIPGRIGYTIRDLESGPYIASNTIKVRSQDNWWYDYTTGKQFTSLDSYVAIDNNKCVGVRIENNKITLECTRFGSIQAIGINATLWSSLKVWNNTIEYKYSSPWSNQPNIHPVMLVQASMLSTIDMDNNVLKGIGSLAASGSQQPSVAGIVESYRATVTSSQDKMTGLDFAIVVRDFSTASLGTDSITQVLQSGVQVLGSSDLTVRGTTLTGNARGMEVVRSTANIYDSVINISDPKMPTTSEFILDNAASVNLFNTQHIRGAVLLNDTDSFFNVSWPVHLTVLWQNDLPADGASVSVRDMVSSLVFSGTTDANGSVGDNIWLKDYMGHNGVMTKLTPHRIYVSKARVDSMDIYDITAPMDITFRLVDNIPPALDLTRPYDRELFDHSLVTFSGTASDPESGLLGSAILINIDNTGFVSVDAGDGNWSLTLPFSDGTHIARIIAEDGVGNQGRATISFTVDTVAPVLQVFTPLDGSYTNHRTITVTGISESGAFITVNGLPAPMEERLFSKMLSLKDGLSTITVMASDATGNTRTVIVHVVLDTQQPALDMTNPKPGTYTSQNPVSVVGTTEPLAIVKVNGLSAHLVNSSFEAMVDLSEGANTLVVSSTDLAGNTNSQTFIIYLDIVAPDLTVFTPLDGLWTNSSRVLVSGVTEQGAAVTINGQNTNVVSTVFSGYVNLLEGPNTIKVVAKDQAGNTRTETRTVYLDTRVPDLIVTTPADNIAVASRVIAVVGSVDFGTDVFVNGEQVTVTDFVFSTSVQFTQDGSQVIEIVARDRAGNIAIATRTLNVDTLNPAIMLSFPQDGMKVKQRVVVVSGRTEPYSTVVINSGTMIDVGQDGLFSVPVLLEDGPNRIILKVTDAAGNSVTQTLIVFKSRSAGPAQQDLTWMLNLTGMFIGIGIALPVATYELTGSWSRRRQKLLVEAVETARREREATEARWAALSPAERIALTRKPPAEPVLRAEIKTLAKELAAAYFDQNRIRTMISTAFGVEASKQFDAWDKWKAEHEKRPPVMVEPVLKAEIKTLAKELTAESLDRNRIHTIINTVFGAEASRQFDAWDKWRVELQKRPPVMAEPPRPEPTTPETAKLGLKDRSGTTEATPAETDQTTRMMAQFAPSEEPKAQKPGDDDAAGLKDKGGKTEGAAGETELPSGIKKT